MWTIPLETWQVVQILNNAISLNVILTYYRLHDTNSHAIWNTRLVYLAFILFQRCTVRLVETLKVYFLACIVYSSKVWVEYLCGLTMPGLSKDIRHYTRHLYSPQVIYNCYLYYYLLPFAIIFLTIKILKGSYWNHVRRFGLKMMIVTFMNWNYAHAIKGGIRTVWLSTKYCNSSSWKSRERDACLQNFSPRKDRNWIQGRICTLSISILCGFILCQVKY